MINYWAVLAAAVLAIVIGSIWWGPLFGKMWMRENGLDKLSPGEQDKMQKGMGMLYAQQAILSLLQAWVLAYTLNKLGSSGAVEGMKFAAIFWIGFNLPIQYGTILWGNKKFKFVSAVLASSFITMITMGAIVGAW